MSGMRAAFGGVLGGGLQTALLLARGRPDGLVRLLAPPADPLAVARRSFWALPLCLPAFLLLDAWGADSPRTALLLGIDTIGFVVGWLGFAVLSFEAVQRIGRGALWLRFIAAWNWSNVAQHVLILAASSLGHFGAPDLVYEVAWVFAAGWALWIEWYATRLTLGLSGLAAAVFVVLDLAVGLLASGLADSIT